MNSAILLRKVQGKLTACMRTGWLSMTSLRQGPSLSALTFAACFALIVPVLVLALFALIAGHLEPSFAAAPFGVALLGNTATAEARDLNTILSDIDAIEKKYNGKPLPQNEGEKLEALYAEGKELQDAADRKKRRQALGAFAREVPDPALPDAKKKEHDEAEVKSLKNRIAGFMRVSDFVALSGPYAKWLAKGGAKAAKGSANGSIYFDVPNLLKVPAFGGVLRKGFVPLGKEMRDEIKNAAMESKDLAILGDGVIEPERLQDIVRDTENDQLTMRDVLNVSPTSSPLIQWVARKSYTRGADVQSEGTTAATQGLKPEADAEYEIRETSVKTVGVTIPVTEQQLQDIPAIINLIQEDMLWDLKKAEEEKITWDDETDDLEFAGLVDNIAEAANNGGYTSLIDILRTMVTEIRVSGYQPTAVTIHPEEWETIELEKGSDGHYIWAIIRDVLGPRIWGMRVVESIAMEEPGGGTGRVMIAGDFKRGATLYDRLQANIALGWVDDQFRRNMRTMRAEERVAFAVRRPDAFRKYTIT